MDDNEKRLEILRRTKKRRKQLDITVILAALAVLFLMAGIYLHQAVYYILFAAALLSAALQVYDLRRTKRQLEEQDRREQEKSNHHTRTPQPLTVRCGVRPVSPPACRSDRRKIRSADMIMETRKGAALSYAPERLAV